MGKVYRRKKRSCSLCKPNKTGHAPKETDKDRQKRKIAEKEIREFNN